MCAEPGFFPGGSSTPYSIFKPYASSQSHQKCMIKWLTYKPPPAVLYYTIRPLGCWLPVCKHRRAAYFFRTNIIWKLSQRIDIVSFGEIFVRTLTGKADSISWNCKVRFCDKIVEWMRRARFNKLSERPRKQDMKILLNEQGKFAIVGTKEQIKKADRKPVRNAIFVSRMRKDINARAERTPVPSRCAIKRLYVEGILRRTGRLLCVIPNRRLIRHHERWEKKYDGFIPPDADRDGRVMELVGKIKQSIYPNWVCRPIHPWHGWAVCAEKTS